MKKHILIKLACLVLAALLIFSGCRSKKVQGEINDISSTQSVTLPSSSEQSSTLPSSSKAEVTSKKPTSSKPVSSLAPSSKPVSSMPVVTEKTDEMRAVWFTYIELDNILRKKTAAQFKTILTPLILR